MARTELTAQRIQRTGVSAAYTAAIGDGHKFLFDKQAFVHIKNTNGSSRTLTIQTPGTVDGLAIADRTVTVAATTGDEMVGPFSTKYLQSDDMVYIDYSETADVTVGIFRLG